jgi:hypothetical protein
VRLAAAATPQGIFLPNDPAILLAAAGACPALKAGLLPGGGPRRLPRKAPGNFPQALFS